jgi:hypothetical protein
MRMPRLPRCRSIARVFPHAPKALQGGTGEIPAEKNAAGDIGLAAACRERREIVVANTLSGSGGRGILHMGDVFKVDLI